MFEFIIAWISNNYIELFGALSGFLYIFLSIKHSIWLWPLGLITSVAYIMVFYRATLYADMLLQVYYFVISIYGWWHWKFSKSENRKAPELPITKLKPFSWFWIVVATIALTFCFYFPFQKYTNASNPLFDGFLTAGSFVATWLLARKIIEQWLIWIVVDAASVVLFVKKELYLTAILFVIYTFMAFVGYRKWLKDCKLNG